MITKDNVISHKDFALLEEYLESMYPDRYEFKEHELLIYYPEVTIKNLNGQTYTIYISLLIMDIIIMHLVSLSYTIQYQII